MLLAVGGRGVGWVGRGKRGGDKGDRRCWLVQERCLLWSIARLVWLKGVAGCVA